MTYSLLHIRMTGVAPLIMRAAVLADPLHPLSRKLSEITRKKLKTDADFERIAQIEWYGSLWAEHGRCNCSRGWRFLSGQATTKVPPTRSRMAVQADCPCRAAVPVTDR